MWLILSLSGRVLLSASASLLQKRLVLSGVPVAHLWRITYLALLPAVPLLLLAARGAPVADGFWRDALAAGALDAAGNLAMVAALRSTDLSVFGPLNGFRPALGWLFGWAFLGEQLSWTGATGVVITIAGTAWLLRDDSGGAGGWRSGALRAAAWRVAGLSLSCVGAVFLKRAVLAGPDAAVLGVWLLAGTPVAWLLGGRGRAPSPPESPGRPRYWLAVHAAGFGLMQWLTLKVFRSAPLAYSFAFFQLAMVLQVLAGHWVLREPGVRRRLAACGVIGLAALLVTFATLR